MALDAKIGNNVIVNCINRLKLQTHFWRRDVNGLAQIRHERNDAVEIPNRQRVRATQFGIWTRRFGLDDLQTAVSCLLAVYRIIVTRHLQSARRLNYFI